MTRTQLILLATGGSVALLAGAFLYQALGYAPCHLCLLQRWPHVVAIGIGVLALTAGWRFLPWLGALAALTTSGLGLYHTGVEQQWWQGPTTCTSGSVTGLSSNQLMDQILNAPLIQCDQVSWEFIGISMASWNMLLSAVLVGIWVMAARR